MSRLPGKIGAKPKRAPADEQDYLVGDDRSQQATAIIRATDAGREIVAEVLGGVTLDDAKLAAVLQARSVVIEQWGRAQSAALRVGQALLALSRTLSEEEFRLIRRGSERLFSFSDSMATKLRMAALAIEENRIPLDQAPPYTVLYEFRTLRPEGQDLARERGLLGPNTKRAEIIAIREELKRHKIGSSVILDGLAEEEEPRTATLAQPDLVSMRAEVEEIERQEAALRAQLARLLEQKAELLRVLDPGGERAGDS